MSVQIPTSTTPEPIAVIGIGCRFPGGASGPEAFWRLLCEGVDTVGEIPEDRWDVGAYYHPDPSQPGKMYDRRGSFLPRVDLFDADFFGISPREAACVDPQQRLLLEVAWEALEDGGQVPQRLAGTPVGVFMGLCTTDYAMLRRGDAPSINSYTGTGGAASIAANRISYVFDFHGPSMAIDTACSSSLVAVHLACESLLRGESSLAVAGGANLIFDPSINISFCKANMLSPRGQCSSFGAQADGFVRAEGVGIVVLKPLSEALADGDPVCAVIRATAVNQDGRTSGISLPNSQAQEDLLRQVYARAGVPPHAVHYVEAHGTGTPAGDPSECDALGKALGAGRPDGDCLRIGSVKSNIGHAEAASGIAGLIKTALALAHRYIPASLHCQTPNPHIPFEALQLRVQQTGEAWPSTGGPAIAGVNSFGFGGTSAHAVLEEFTPPHRNGPAPVSSGAMLLPLSARSPEALRGCAQAYLELLDEGASLQDLCYTASVRREHHPHRLAVVGTTRAEFSESLKAFLAGERRPGQSVSERPARQAPNPVFVFSGNGPQWWAMGRQLLAQEPAFRQAIEACDTLLRHHTGWSLIEELQADEASTRMGRTDIAQPALFALQLGLVALWRSWGVEPAAVVGHSVGEVAAAHVAGVLSLEDAVHVIFHRSRTQQRTAGTGGMAAVGLPAAAAREALAAYEGRVCIASVNSPRSVTLSGDSDALEQILRSLEDQGAFRRRLPLDYAFHSQHMEPIRQDLCASLEGLRARPATVPFFSTVAGRELAGPELDAAYWWDNIRQAVDFSSAVQGLAQDGYTTFLEIGPHPVLSGYVAECLMDQERQGWVLPSLRRKEDERATLLGSLGSLYTLGCAPDWSRLYPAGGRCISLPSYPWQRERHWQGLGPSDLRLWDRQVHPLLGRRLESVHTTFQAQLDTGLLPYLEDHQVQGLTVFPAAGYIEMALAATDLHGTGPWAVEELEIHKPLLLGGAQAPTVQASLSPEDRVFRLHSRAGDGQQGWVLHATGQARSLQPLRDARRLDLGQIRARCTREIPKALFYQLTERRGIQYGPSFQSVERVWVGQDEALGEIRVAAAQGAQSTEYVFHPIALDACFQTMLTTLPGELALYVPVGAERLRVYRRPPERLWCHARVVKRGPGYLRVDLTIADQGQEVAAEITGLRLRPVDRGRDARTTVLEAQLYEERWKLAPRRVSGRRRSARDLPSPSSLTDLERVIPHYDELSAELGRTRYYQEIRPQIEALCAAYVNGALRQLGWRPQPGERVTVPALMERLGIQAEHGRLMTWVLAMLEEDGVLRRVGEAFGVQRVPDSVDPAPLFHDLATRCSAYLPELLVLARCGTRLAQVLTGQVDPLEILFGGQASTTIEHLYESGMTVRIYNALMQGVVSRIVDSLPKDRWLRVLEIGAGTGGTTTCLLPRLPADRTEYVFTDVSEVFLQKAEQKYRKYPFVRYQLLDIEQDPTTQGFEGHSFDLVIAANVLHATRDLRWTLHNVQRLLASEGLLALEEITNPTRAVFTIFGLLPGFWLFLDEDLRPNHALLSHDRWIKLLEEVGFTEAAVLTERQTTPDQSIVLARGPHVGRSVDPAGSPEPREARSWLIFADQTGAAEQAGRLLAARGDRVIFVEAGDGDGCQRHADDRFHIHPSSSGDMARLFSTLRSEQVALTDIVHCWSLDAGVRRLTMDTLVAAQKAGCLSVVHLTQQLVEGASGQAPRLWLVTGGAQALHPGQDPVSIAQSPLVGLRRVIFNEHPEFRCTLVDVGHPTVDDGGPHYGAGDIEELCEELCCDDQEDEVLLRGQARYVARLARASLGGAPPERARSGPGAYRLGILTPGVLDSLSLGPVRRQRPRAREVEIEVHAAGLNFKDLMQVMGLLPAESLEAGYAGRLSLGGECAGRVVAVGDGVTDFQVGDEVIAIGRDALSAFITTDTALVVPRPPSISFEEGATLLVNFLTAHYALHHVARLRRGERVLVHLGTGGVGMAAIQIVRAAGGEVFATAGSPQKRECLRLLGVEHVMDSRSLAFAEEIMEITGGEGVHIVLNSLTGEGLQKSLSVLRRSGRFLELGKRDFLNNSRLGLRPFERCLSLHAIDLDQLMVEDPALVQSLLRDILALVRDGTYHPLPHRAFPVSRAVEAFRHMQQSRHIGKVVVSMREQGVLVAPPPPDGPIALRPDGTYLISGGLGGFGLATARWMIERGARHLVLAGRRGAGSPRARQAVAALREAGAEVLVAQVDVSQEEPVRELVTTIRASLPPLRGVVHAAMVLEDRLVSQLNEELLEKVMAPKVLGAWNLHEQTLGESLDFFVLFSSMTSMLGNPGQGNYVAASAFLDNFAAFRLAQGLPALTVNWGAIADVGYVAEQAAQRERLLRRGVRAVSPNLALETMGRLLQERRVRAGVVDLDWQQLGATLAVASPRWADLLPTEGPGGPSGEQPEGFRQRVIAASADQRAELVTARLSEHLAFVLGASVAKIDPERSTAEVGLDSLMAMEFRTRIEMDFDIDIPVMRLMQARSLADLTAFLIEQLTEANQRQAPSQALAAPAASTSGQKVMTR
ncbi:MAG: SDR family NAD(P)-dependent oxidoreductase [Egibacteraceae bacterium]